ncbi:MAG: ABC transporter permease [Deltaproteobacteria bacterium]|nr:ABC transporter permease [Deltaproteobacteria bacterium]MBW2121443.1 ABC transporter permease [Deltaproteobacteria bacterium]
MNPRKQASHSYVVSKTARILGRRAQVRWLLLLLGPVLLLLTFYAYPIARMLTISFFDPDFTLKHYMHFFKIPAYSRVLVETFKMAASVTVFCLVLGYPVAYLLANIPPRVRNLLMILVILPFMTAILVRTYAWMVILGRNGLVNQFLIKSGITSSPLKLMHNLFGVYVGMVQILLPFMIFPLYSVMVGIDKGLMKAAENLGANPVQVFLRIFLPLSLPGVGGGGLLVFIIALGFFITPALLGGVSDVMISMFIETQVNTLLNWGFASAMSVILLIITLVLFSVYTRYFGVDRTFGG